MNAKEFKQKITGFSVVNEFKNEAGETYLILECKWVNGYFIAGDETDWEIYRLHKSGKYAYQEFTFDKKEAATIKRVLEIAEKEK